MNRWLKAVLVVAGLTTSVRGDDPPSPDKSPTRGALWATATSTDHARAGCPQSVRPHARPSRGPGRVGYYVGGSATPLGEARDPQVEGIWGTDYQPWVLPRVVTPPLRHGRKQQAAQAAYRSDGPKLRD